MKKHTSNFAQLRPYLSAAQAFRLRRATALMDHATAEEICLLLLVECKYATVPVIENRILGYVYKVIKAEVFSC